MRGLEQRPVTAGRSILQRVCIVPIEQADADLAQLLPREKRRVGIPGRERHHVAGARDDRAHAPNG